MVDLIQVLAIEIVVLGIQVGDLAYLTQLQRVQVGDLMAAKAVGVDQP